MPHTDTVPVSASTAVATTGLGIRYIGGKIWAGWSGLIVVNNGTTDMFKFVSPNIGLIVRNFQYYVRHSANSPGSAEYIGWNLLLNDMDIVTNHLKATSIQHYNDFDQNMFVIPPNTTCQIESYTNTSADIHTYANIVLEEIK